MDITVSLIFICLILSWLYPIIALLIKLESDGPIFFKQKRVGRGGRTFLCIKFRTMVVNNEADKVQAVKNDSRITRFGHFLRDSNIDEFPQFFNVLIGDMSIVGPRPHMLSDCIKFASFIEGYKFRNLVKPGLTGLAQMKGFHGPITSSDGIFSRFKWDAVYIQDANLWLDLHIIMSTAVQQMRSIWQYVSRKKDAELSGSRFQQEPSSPAID